MKGENLEEKPRILTGCDACPSYEFFRYGDTHLGDFRSVSAQDHRDFPLRKPMRHHGNSSIGARTTTFHTLCQPQTPAASHRNFSDLSLTTITSCTSNYSILHIYIATDFLRIMCLSRSRGPQARWSFLVCLITTRHRMNAKSSADTSILSEAGLSGRPARLRPLLSLVPKWEVSRHPE